MQQVQLTLTARQKTELAYVIKRHKVETREVDGRSINALERRGLVKINETKKGTFVVATAKGKKLN